MSHGVPPGVPPEITFHSEVAGRARPSLVRGWSTPAWDLRNPAEIQRRKSSNEDDDDDDERDSADGRSTARSSRNSHQILVGPYSGFGRRNTVGTNVFNNPSLNPTTTFDAELLQRSGGDTNDSRLFGSVNSRDSSASASASINAKGPRTKTHHKDESFFTELQRRWNYFSLFGLSRDPSPHIWGTHIKICNRTMKSGDAMQRIVRNHESQSEMALMLRDTRVKFSYFDLFETDYDFQPKSMIRCFSSGAYYLELAKIMLGAEALVVAVVIFCFWEVKSSELFPPMGLCVADFVFDIFYLLFFALELRTTILDHERGAEICDPKVILLRSLRSITFWLELLSLFLPTLLIRHFRERGNSSEVVRQLVIFRMVRGYRVWNKPTRHRFIPKQSFIFLRLFCAILLFGHVLACFWYLLFFELLLTHSEEDLPRVPGKQKAQFIDYYAHSFNEGIYLLMGIDRQGKSTGEHFVLALVLPCAAIFHAYIFGEIFLVIQRISALETKAQEHDMAIKEAMKVLGLSPALQLRIISYFTYERLHRNAQAFQELFRLLSPQLRFELHLFLYTDLIANTNLFRKSQPRIIRDMVTLLLDIIFLPGDYVVRFGEHGDSMYFIIKGKCAVLASDNETILSVLERGSYFGEIALLTGVRRTAYVRSDVFCVLAQLTKSAFEPIIREYPEEIDILVGEIINVAEREKVRDEALRYYGMRGNNVGRASMASSHQWNQAPPELRVSAVVAPDGLPHEAARLRVPSSIFRRNSNASARMLKPNLGSADSLSTDGPDTSRRTTASARNTIQIVSSRQVESAALLKNDGISAASSILGSHIIDAKAADGDIEEFPPARPDGKETNESFTATEPTNTDSRPRESRMSGSGWAVPGKSILSRLSITGRSSRRLSMGKPTGPKMMHDFAPSLDSVIMSNKVVEEVKCLRDQLTELMISVAEIPTGLQQHQIQFAQLMASAKDEVVDELWDRFGTLPLDVQELTLAFNDMVRLEDG